MEEKSDIDKNKPKIFALEQTVLSSINSVIQPNLFEKQTLSLLENAPICIKILDLDFNLQYMSPAGVKSLNIDDVNSLYGNPYPFDFYPKSFCDRMSKNLNKAVQKNEIITQEANVYDLKGNELWYHSTIIPVESENGENETILVISIESTASKKAERELSQLKELQEKIGVQFQIEHSNKNNKKSFMTKVTNIVLANIHDNKFDVNVLAEHLFMSRSTLQRKMTKESAGSAALFIRQRRLAKAHGLIKNKENSTLAETAYAVGFKHPGYFAKLYREYVLSTEYDAKLSFEHQTLDVFTENIRAIYDNILSAGLNALSLTLGVISQIENELYKIVAVISENNIFVPGQVFRLQDTYCREVFVNGKTLALTQIEDKPGLCKHPLYNQMPLEAYISTPIYKHGKIWGTLNFSSKQIKHDKFKEKEIAFIENIAKTVSTTF